VHDLAVIGCGRIGRIHANNVVAEPRLRLRYVVDPVDAAAEAVAAQTGATKGTLAEVLGDPAVAGVIVASSTDTHLDFSLAALRAGKAVFCEKPIDLDLTRARAAAPVFTEHGHRLLMGFNRRFDVNFAALRDKLQSGDIGRLETLHIISHDPAPPPIDYVGVSGGLFRDMTIHDFDMARWLLGEEPTQVYAAAANLVDPAIGEAGDVDTAKVLLRAASGRICMISNSRRSAYGYDQRIEAFCSGGLLRVGNVSSTTLEAWSESGPTHSQFENFFLQRYAQAYRAELEHFVEVLDGEASPLAGYDDAVAALELAEAAGRSAQLGQVVTLS
jgi:myo-inositol 2-dehydrogenase/D-chiro-inositol 1-dehydrogenase